MKFECFHLFIKLSWFFFFFFWMNSRFVELSSVLEPGRPPKSDKAMILSDAARALVQLRSDVQQLKEANEKFQETIKDLKVCYLRMLICCFPFKNMEADLVK